jgi:serine/threonine-protein kinase RsbW
MVQDTLALKIESRQENIIKVEHFLEQLSNEHDVRDEMYGNVLIALSEGANNAIFHGNQEDPSKFVSIELVEKTAAHIILSIADEGPGFDPDSLPDPTAPENLEKPTGRGVFLMKQLADEIEFLQEGSEIRLKFNF